VPKHEAKLCEERKREYGRSGEGERGEYEWSVWFGTRQQHGDSVRHGPRDLRTLAVTGKVDMVPMVEANGSKPISPLSVAAEPHCVSIKELQLGRRAFNGPA
jgi:hypothetical protein